MTLHETMTPIPIWTWWLLGHGNWNTQGPISNCPHLGQENDDNPIANALLNNENAELGQLDFSCRTQHRNECIVSLSLKSSWDRRERIHLFNVMFRKGIWHAWLCEDLASTTATYVPTSDDCSAPCKARLCSLPRTMFFDSSIPLQWKKSVLSQYHRLHTLAYIVRSTTGGTSARSTDRKSVV